MDERAYFKVAFSEPKPSPCIVSCSIVVQVWMVSKSLKSIFRQHREKADVKRSIMKKAPS